jgi:predicted transcriptional regulator
MSPTVEVDEETRRRLDELREAERRHRERLNLWQQGLVSNEDFEEEKKNFE